jgi:MFS family permease
MRSHNFRLFFYGQLVSTTGTWIQTLALGWLVLRITGSGFAVGVVTALQFLPMLLLGTYGGVIADRLDKRRTLIMTQAGMAVTSAVLAVIAIMGSDPLWAIYLVTFLSGVFFAVDMPVRQSFLSEMVGNDDLPNAVALNSAMFNTSRVIGPAVGAVMIKLVDVGPCFAVNAVSFVAVIAGLMLMRTDELYRTAGVVRAKRQAREGLSYVWQTPELRATILLMAVVGTLAFNFTVVLPVLAKFTFQGDAATFGWFSSLMGLGSVFGALAVASKLQPTAKLLVGTALAFGAVMLLSAVAPTLMSENATMVLLGATSITFMATANSTCQLTSVPEMRGRVMALYGLVFLGSTPIGGPIVGWIDQDFGPRWGLAIGGIATLVAAGAMASVLLRRQFVIRHGQMVAGLDPVAEPAAA